MNGIFTLKVGKKSHKLIFNLLSVLEFERRSFFNHAENNAKLITDIIYAGLFGNAMREEQPLPPYSQAFDIHDEIAEKDDYDEVRMKIFNAFNESKYGGEFLQKMLDFQKKSLEQSLEASKQ